MNSGKKIILFLVVIFISSCTVVGELNPKAKIDLTGTGKSRLIGDGKFANNTFITSIDQRSLYRLGADSDFPRSMLIDSGRHRIGIRYGNGYVYSDGFLWLDVGLEQVYKIKVKQHRYSVSFWLEDEAGNVVGSMFDPEEIYENKKN